MDLVVVSTFFQDTLVHFGNFMGEMSKKFKWVLMSLWNEKSDQVLVTLFNSQSWIKLTSFNTWFDDFCAIYIIELQN